MAGSTLRFNQFTDSHNFEAATNVKVLTPGCETSASGDGGALFWRRANLTNFTSYPEPGSDECINYNGCLWEGQFGTLNGKQPEAWVRANNIVAVHSRHFAQYKLRTLRLKQGTNKSTSRSMTCAPIQIATVAVQRTAGGLGS